MEGILVQCLVLHIWKFMPSDENDPKKSPRESYSKSTMTQNTSHLEKQSLCHIVSMGILCGTACYATNMNLESLTHHRYILNLWLSPYLLNSNAK